MADNILDQNIGNSELSISPEIKSFLRETAKWAKFLSIVGFVFIAIFIILGVSISIFSGSVLSGLGEAGSAVPAGMLGTVGIVYVIMALIYLIPLNFLYKFSSKMKIALAQDDQQFLSESFRNLKSIFKFVGILMAVIIGIYGVILVLGLMGGLFAVFAG